MALPRSLQPASVAVCVATLALSLQAQVYTFTTDLSGAAEEPPNASPASGIADLIWDSTAHTMTLDVGFADLIGTTTAAHIHAPTTVPGAGTVGVASQTPYFTGFPLGVTSGTYLHTFDLTDPASYGAGFLGGAGGGTTAGAETALLAALLEGKAYLNIHSTFAGGGEIRGFFRRVHGLPDGGATLPMLLGTCLGSLLIFRGCHRRN